MANFAVTDHVTIADTVDAVAALLETYIETVDDAKTLRYIDVILQSDGNYKGFVIHDA